MKKIFLVSLLIISVGISFFIFTDNFVKGRLPKRENLSGIKFVDDEFIRLYKIEKIDKDWKITVARIDYRKTNIFAFSIGICEYDKKTITISEGLFKKEYFVFNQPAIIEAIRHEYAHILTQGDDHGELWQRKCKKLGANPEPFLKIPIKIDFIEIEEIISLMKENTRRLKNVNKK